MKRHELKFLALEMKQGKDRKIYSFATDGKIVYKFAAISRIKRTEDSGFIGYQRPEILSHISEIRSYIESENPMIPNVIVIAFDERVRFEPLEDEMSSSSFSRIGYFIIPFEEALEDKDKPGWIVDGQQRIAAIREADISSFPVYVNAFITRDINEQRGQFILVNSTKPLPKSLLYELLPVTDVKLPTFLEKRKFPTYLLARLNNDDKSPLKGFIHTPTNQGGLIKDNSILKMIENSLNDGVLYGFRDSFTGECDVNGMLALLHDYWKAVSTVFNESWGLKPQSSRLFHGAGVIALGFLMDAICDRYRIEGIPTMEQFEIELIPLKKYCRWINGYWDFGPGSQRKWNELQNTPGDIKLLSNYLLVKYKMIVWDKNQKSMQGVI